MDYISIDKQLNEHEAYVKLLNMIRYKTKYVEVVLINGERFDDLLDSVWDYIAEHRVVNRWWGTVRGGRGADLYKIYSSKRLFDQLSKYSTFCVVTTDDEHGEWVEETDFGDKDIAFFDEKKEPMLFTITHEGYVGLRKDLKKEKENAIIQTTFKNVIIYLQKEVPAVMLVPLSLYPLHF